MSQVQKDMLHVMVTGANSGVGFGLVQRFLDYYERHEALVLPRLHLVLACRNLGRAEEAIRKLRVQFPRVLQVAVDPKVHLHILQVDVSDPASVEQACREYKVKHKQLDILYLNAGVLLIDGVDVAGGLKNLFLRPSSFFTDVSGTLRQTKGAMCPKYPRLGQVFAANVYGHYLMIRYLQDIMKDTRLIWTGSQTSQPEFFDVDDIQSLQTRHAYESSKFVTELLALELNREFKDNDTPARVYVADPGVVFTNIVAGTVSWLLSMVLMMPVLFVAQYFVDAVTYSPFKGSTSLFYLSGLAGMEQELNVVKLSLKKCERKSTSISEELPSSVKYSSASKGRKGRCFVVERPMSEAAQVSAQGQRSILKYLDELKGKLK